MSSELSELLDYEAQIARDTHLSAEELSTRDSRLTKRLKLDAMGKKQAISIWLKELKLSEGPWPGESLLRAYDALVAFVFLLGIVSGVGMIQSLLRYDGSEPVNVIPFLAIYGVLQFLLLIWYLGKSLLAGYFHRLPGGALISFLKDFAGRYIQKRPQLFARVGLGEKALESFRRRLGDLHKKLLLLHAWKVFQVFGLSFHLASLITFAVLISFNDYTFAWRTTLHWDAAFFHSIVQVIASPFAWMKDGLQPSLELVEASQFNRYQKDFLGSPGKGLGSVGWWPFLAAVIAFFGVLPRFLIWLQLKVSIRAYLRRWDYADYQSESLWQRLKANGADWRHSGTEALRAVPDQALASGKTIAQRNALVVRWRDVALSPRSLEDFLQEKHGIRVQDSLEARGLAKDAREILSRLDKEALLLIVSDPFELPGEAIDKLRLVVRERFGRLPILFAPLRELSGEIKISGDLKAWRHALQIYRDPYLGLLEENLS